MTRGRSTAAKANTGGGPRNAPSPGASTQQGGGMARSQDYVAVVHKAIVLGGKKTLSCATKLEAVVEMMIQNKRAIAGPNWEGVNCGMCLAQKPLLG